MLETSIPKNSTVLAALLRADFTILWRNRRSLRLVLLLPLIILFSWKGLVDKLGGVFVLSSCITIGLTSIGLMGYTNSIARDRDRGIFQRLRVGPVSAWTIMTSRLLVQVAMILLMTILIFIGGYFVDHIQLSPAGYVAGLLLAMLGGAVYLGMGQAIVGRIKNPDTVNSTTRLVYFVFIMIGMFGEFGMLGEILGKIVVWSPYGVVRRVLASSLAPATWTMENTYALLASVGYAAVFIVLGVKWFKWESK
ncbi:ABC-2 type transport system permease protein [Chitinophaga polysaccharea]|uniref:ABC-2 type transport system permease protein n=1 Tax=Chitinophaga polysaccharea TaxID=1293035 RepID=A0A561PB98_9BACT|nr:ABC transporter permease [Chitinophaga polysaccharea]TWF35389.1 ABC-2 type transport system permease protein [Chitinophaga polysaccharea]